MSLILIRQYKKIYKPLLEYSFKNKGKLYYKISNNEILQTIMLDANSVGRRFTINIGLFPLCSGIEKMQIIKGAAFNLGEIDNFVDSWWEYNPNNINEIDLALTATFKRIKSTILNIFNNVTNCSSYIEFINKLESNIYGHGIENSETKMWVYLNLKNYEEVINIINNIEQQNYTAAAANIYAFTKDDYVKYLNEIEYDLNELRLIKSAIQNDDKIYLELLLQNKYKKSYDVLKCLG